METTCVVSAAIGSSTCSASSGWNATPRTDPMSRSDVALRSVVRMA